MPVYVSEELACSGYNVRDLFSEVKRKGIPNSKIGDRLSIEDGLVMKKKVLGGKASR